MALVVHAHGQAGIHFEQQLKWSEILEKAKAEHKYIFVDCYATWCGPCKWMDENVYADQKAGDFFNKNFISVRVQMDQTAKDDDRTKNWYGMAISFEKDYTVNAYPTFLFFNEDGKPVHKSSGSLDTKLFISLGQDAQIPEKQYYHILNTFRPGLLDTTEEKGLARSFRYSDKILGGKIAADYLSRIPREQLKTQDNGNLMIQFQDNGQVIALAADYLTSFSIQQLAERETTNLIYAMIGHPQIKAIVSNCLSKLTPSLLDERAIREFLVTFSEEPEARNVAMPYINSLPEDSIYSPKTLDFISHFDQSRSDRAFKVFYDHSARVDSVMKKSGYAHSRIGRMVINTEFTPLLKRAEVSGTEPDWPGIHKYIANNYDAVLGDEVLVQGKVDWYEYLVRNKHADQYWSKLTDAQFNRVLYFRWDTIRAASNAVNDIVYNYIFQHSDDPKQLDLATSWMKTIVKMVANKNDLNTISIMDTYASMLYKTGDIANAIEWEKKASKVATSLKYTPDIDHCNKTIAAMSRGQKIWLDKTITN